MIYSTLKRKNMETKTKNSSKEVVMSFVNALNSEDFDAARKCVSDDMSFRGVLGSRDGAEAYFKDMKNMKFKYDIKKTFVDGNDVCLFYDINMSGKTILTCGWYHVEDGKISSLRVIFDPRPVLEAADKRHN
jgi:limonene-1,2-epoxide hydrolase